jgi:hypothetical protein
MQFRLEHAYEVLERTPPLLRAWLAERDAAWTHANYGPDTFSPFDVVGHLIAGERTDWMARLRIILQNGPSRPFDRFDRTAMYAESRGKTMQQLLAAFEQLRARNLGELRSLNLLPEQLALPGMHPDLGAVTLQQLLATWVVHDLNHIAQIAKAMAYQYRDQVGPWSAYLPILPR